MIKTILVPATGSDTDEAVFTSALTVARAFDAHLTGPAGSQLKNPAQARSARRRNVYRETNNVEQLTPSSVTAKEACRTSTIGRQFGLADEIVDCAKPASAHSR